MTRLRFGLAAVSVALLFLVGYGGYRIWRHVQAPAANPLMPTCGVAYAGPVPPSPVVAFGDDITWGYGASRSCVPWSAPTTAPGPHADGGDSTTYPADLGRILGHPVLNYGAPGETTDAGLRRLPAVLKATRPQVVVLLEGINDLRAGQTVAHVLKTLAAMTRMCELAGARVVLVTPLPSYGPAPRGPAVDREAAQLARDLPARAAQLRASIADAYGAFSQLDGVNSYARMLHSDGLHPNDAGYRLLARVVAPLVVAAPAQ